MNKRLGMIAGAGLFGLAACGDSALVQRCIEEGKSAEWCRCSDRILRSELSDREYRLVERAAEDDGEAIEKAMEEGGAGFALSFASKMTATAMKIAQRCEGK